MNKKINIGLIIVNILFLLLSVGYFLTIKSIDQCSLTKYEIFFIIVLSWFAFINTIYFILKLICDECCCLCIYGVNIVGVLLTIICLVIFESNSIFKYNFGFDNICKLIYTSYMISIPIFILFIIICAIMLFITRNHTYV
jgi:hypothetical protein